MVMEKSNSHTYNPTTREPPIDDPTTREPTTAMICLSFFI